MTVIDDDPVARPMASDPGHDAECIDGPDVADEGQVAPTEDPCDTDARGRSSDRDAETEVWAAVEVLLGVDVGQCGFDELDVIRGASQRLRGFIASVDVRVARRNDELLQSWLHPPGPDEGADRSDGCDPATGTDDGRGPGGTGTGGDMSPGEGATGAHTGIGDASGFGGTRERRSDAEVARDRARSQACTSMPVFESALATGRIDVAHLDVVVGVLARIDVDEVRAELVSRAEELVGYAGVESPERFRRRCNDLVRRLSRQHGIETTARQRRAANVRSWWNRASGMFHLHLEVEPELGAKLETAIEQRIASRRDQRTNETFERLKVEAIAEMMTSSSALDPRAPEIVVLIDHDTLRTGLLSAGGLCESLGGGELSPDTVRRLACDAGITPVVMSGDGIPLDVGRTERVATKAQRRALRAMYRTCAHPNCTRPFNWCRIHHIVFWGAGGLTDLDVLLPLCDEHHHQVHEGGWTLTMTPDRVCTWTTPTGYQWFTGDTRDARPRRTSIDDGLARTLGVDERQTGSGTCPGSGFGSDESSRNAGTGADDEIDVSTTAATAGGTTRLTTRRRSATEAATDQLDLLSTTTEPAGP